MELVALFVNIREVRVVCLIIAELGHPHPPTPIYIDITPAIGIQLNDQETEITIDGDEIFLASWSDFAEIIQLLLPTRSGATNRLP